MFAMTAMLASVCVCVCVDDADDDNGNADYINDEELE